MISSCLDLLPNVCMRFMLDSQIGFPGPLSVWGASLPSCDTVRDCRGSISWDARVTTVSGAVTVSLIGYWLLETGDGDGVLRDEGTMRFFGCR